MNINIKNSTDKNIVVNDENNNPIIIEPYLSKDVNFEDSFSLSVGSKKSFFERIKTELSLKQIDLRFLRHKINYTTYVKTVVTKNSQNIKRQNIEIKESVFIKNSELELRCLDVVENTDLINNQFEFVDKQQKLAVVLSYLFIIGIKYGWIGIVGIFALLISLLDPIFFAESEIELFIIIVFCFCFLIAYMIKSIQLIKILNALK